jgi:glycosyltransferase involved in cell wall biosynthesis
MRVANVIEEGRFGGPQRRITIVARALRAHGVETVVVLPEIDSDRFCRYLTSHAVAHQVLPLHRLTREKTHLAAFLFRFPLEVWELTRFLKMNRFDVCHVSGGAWQVKGAIAGRLAGCATIWHLNDASMPLFFRMVFGVLSRWCADGFIVSGARVQEHYSAPLRAINKPVFTVRPPVDCSVFDPDAVAPDKRIHRNDGGISITTVANVNPGKGLTDFIEMASIVSAQHENVSFWIVGPVFASQRKYYERLAQMIRERSLHNLFFMTTDNVPAVLKATDVFVCSSHAESGPMTVWEAMSMAKPVVSTAVGDVPLVIEDGVSGFVVPCHAPEVLAERVDRLILDQPLRASLGAAAREVALRHLDVKHAASRHKEAYEEVYCQRRKRRGKWP